MNAQASPPTRILNFDGGCNFRDLGGYPTRNGRETLWGRVYRTGVLSYFSTLDHERLRKMEMRAICDLRRAEEREREPTRWPKNLSGTSARQLIWDDGAAPPTVRIMAAKYSDDAAGMRLAMQDLYRALPEWMTPRLRDMFACASTAELPMIVHCAAGKDRTGIAIALLLAALDVPEDVIVEDYLLTNQAGDFEQFILSRQQHNQQSELGLATTNHPLLLLSEDVRRVLFAADADYLQAAFEQIKTDHGSIEMFLRTQVGVDDDMRQRLRATLLSE